MMDKEKQRSQRALKTLIEDSLVDDIIELSNKNSREEISTAKK